MSGSHMEAAGLDPSRRAEIERQAALAEQYVATILGGVLLDDPYDRRGDVLLSSGEIVNVKCVPIGFRFVNGGDITTRPSTRVIVVERRAVGFWAVGDIPPERFVTFSVPPVGAKLDPRPCWWVRRSDVRAVLDPRQLASPRRTAEADSGPARPTETPVSRSASEASGPTAADHIVRPGLWTSDDVEVVTKTEAELAVERAMRDEELHADWRERDRKRRLRRKAKPAPLPEIGDPDHPGTGLAARRGHPPGKDNRRRQRP